MDKFRQETIRLLAHYEGRKPIPYEDTRNRLTVGIGHNLDDNPLTDEQLVKFGLEHVEDEWDIRLSVDQMDQLLLDDLREADHEYKRFGMPSYLRREAEEIVTRMIFNMGFKGVRGFHGMFRALRMGQYRWAGLEMLDSVWARDQEPKRAAEEAKRMMDLDPR